MWGWHIICLEECLEECERENDLRYKEQCALAASTACRLTRVALGRDGAAHAGSLRRGGGGGVDASVARTWQRALRHNYRSFRCDTAAAALRLLYTPAHDAPTETSVAWSSASHAEETRQWLSFSVKIAHPPTSESFIRPHHFQPDKLPLPLHTLAGCQVSGGRAGN